ncbi:hypothetical protein HU200_058177 [Digitaria exilis]|uniref:Uncharacterized protein n=1 Tax=Digitaria exilis TaxID=1010633 RepID=A0A835A9Z0_9POAL|nr:hypothetical protein HU200_058175 [Digitaria exilis]KAF8659718.1 hypothetical protein HU200_058177 [Digitaria exilis]
MTTVLMCGPSAITTSFASCKCMMDFKMVVAGSSGVPLGRPTFERNCPDVWCKCPYHMKKNQPPPPPTSSGGGAGPF